MEKMKLQFLSLLLLLGSFSELECKIPYYFELHKNEICHDECKSYRDSDQNLRWCIKECLQRQQNNLDYEIGGLQALVIPTLKIKGSFNVMVVWKMVYPTPDDFTVIVKEGCSSSRAPVSSTVSGRAESSKYFPCLRLSRDFEVSVTARWGDVEKTSWISKCSPGPRGELNKIGLCLKIFLGLLSIGCFLVAADVV